MSLIHTPPRGLASVLDGAVSRRCVEYRDRTDELLRLHGKCADAPHVGESDMAYAARLLQSAAPYAGAPFESIDFTQQPTTAIPGLFESVVDEAVKAFKAPVGPLREVIEHSRGGPHISHFYGDPEYTWAPFKAQPQLVEKFLNLGKGSDSPGARARRAAAEARHHAAEAALRREEAAHAAAAPSAPGLLHRLRAAVSNTDAT